MNTKKQKNTVFEDVLSTVTRYFAVLIVIVVLLICLSGLRIVKSGEVAIILRFGRLVGSSYDEQVHEAGLLFAFPYIIDEVITVPVGSVMEQKVSTHYTQGQMTSYFRNGYVITGDSNIAVITASVKYVISDPVAYALNTADVSALINSAVSDSMVNAAASVPVDDLLTTGKDAYASEVLNGAQKKLSALGAGVTLGSVELTTVAMPTEVRDIYDMVNSASVQSATTLERARQYRESLLPQAQATANTLIADANAAYSTSVASANADLAEFWGVLEEYRSNPDVVRVRIYSEKLSSILSRITVRTVAGDEKIILGGQN